MCIHHIQGSLYQTIPESVIRILDRHGCHDEDATPSVYLYALKNEKLQASMAKGLKYRLTPRSFERKVAAMLDQHNNALHGTRFADAVFDARTGLPPPPHLIDVYVYLNLISYFLSFCSLAQAILCRGVRTTSTSGLALRICSFTSNASPASAVV